MTTSSLFRRVTGSLALFAAAWIGEAAAQDYPVRTVTMVVPYPAGGTGSDVVARIIAQPLSEALKQPVVIDNKPGASTNIGTEFVARAAPDGYTLLFQAPNLATNEALFNNLKWGIKDFVGVIHVARYTNVLVAGPGAKAVDFREMISQSKVNPKAFSYGSPGVGSISHLATELVRQSTGLVMEHVSYRGATPMAIDLSGGHLPYAVSSISNVFSAAKDAKDSKGAIKPVVVLSQRRDPALPDVPSLADLGIPNLEGSGWYGIAAPVKTPAAIVARLNQEINRVLRLAPVQERLKALHLNIEGGTPEEFTRFFHAESSKWSAIVKSANIKAEP